MRFHDFHLSSYLVSDHGSRITLNLVLDDPQRGREESHLEFTDVICYRFIHTGGAIITDLYEESLESFVQTEEAFLSATAANQGLPGWRNDAASYGQFLAQENYRVWRIDSAVGFAGLVVAKTVGDALDTVRSAGE